MIRKLSFLALMAGFAIISLTQCSNDPADQNLFPTSPAPEPLHVSASNLGGVYTMTNGVDHNEIIAFHRNRDGSLSPLGRFDTGGQGTGGTIDPLRSQYALALSDDHDLLFAVNAGSNDISVLRVRRDASLELTDRISSGGMLPVSISVRHGLLFVLNAGDNTINGFRVTDGRLIRIPDSTRSLADGAAGASTIRFTPDGHSLVITERDANRLETFPVGNDGAPGDPVVTPSHGSVPFGFDVTHQGMPIVSEAMGAAPDGAVSSYDLKHGGSLSVISGSVDTGGRASCWLILSRRGDFAFVANAGSNAIASMGVSGRGEVALLNPTAGFTGAGSTPLDLDLVSDRYLYVLEGGSGNIGAFEIGAGGALTERPDTPAGPPASGMQGIAVW